MSRWKPVTESMGSVRPKAIALMGPTASGKSALALEWAQRFDGEIVSVDSALVYRGLDIGAAKPTRDEQALAPHHLLDVRDPWQTYSAAEFANDARNAIAGIVTRGRLPILVGGTGLYFRALLQGLPDMPAADPEVRGQLEGEAAERGWAALHADLQSIDPEAAARIHATDAQRIQRALEVWRLSGRTISDWQRDPAGQAPALDLLTVVVAPADRAALHARIEARFDAMLAAGFLDEVRALRALPQLAGHPAPLALPALRAVGYRQAWDHLEGATPVAGFRDKAIFATRQLARRQLTWLRREQPQPWFCPERDGGPMAQVLARFGVTSARRRHGDGGSGDAAG